MSKKLQDRSIDILEAGPEKNFSIKLLGQPEKFFVTAQRMAEYVEQMKPSEWRDDMSIVKALEDGRYKGGGYRLPVDEEQLYDKKLKDKGGTTYESRKAKNTAAREKEQKEFEKKGDNQ
jgi:hypothetical protein